MKVKQGQTTKSRSEASSKHQEITFIRGTEHNKVEMFGTTLILTTGNLRDYLMKMSQHKQETRAERICVLKTR